MSIPFYRTLLVLFVPVLVPSHVANAATWTGLGGSIFPADSVSSSIAVIHNSNGALQAFARGSDNAVWTIAQTSPDGPWGAWQSLGGGLTSDPAVGMNGSGLLEVFVLGGDDLLWEISQVAPNGTLSSWQRLPIPLASSGRGQTLTGKPAVTTDATGKLHVFATGTDQAVWTIAETSPGGPWGSWMSLGGLIGDSPSAITNTNGSIEVFVQGGSYDSAVWHNWTVDSNFDWNGWELLATQLSTGNTVPTGQPVAVVNPSSGWAAVFAKGSVGNSLWYSLHQPGQGWSPFISLGGYLTSDPAVAFGKNGSIDVFVRGGDNALWFISAQPSPYVFGSWATLGGALANGPTPALNQDGREAVFVDGTDAAMWTIEQSLPGSWQ